MAMSDLGNYNSIDVVRLEADVPPPVGAFMIAASEMDISLRMS